MKHVKRQAVRFLFRAKAWTRHPKLTRGQTLVEYALILAVISIVAIGVMINLGQQVKGLYTMIDSQVAAAGQSH